MSNQSFQDLRHVHIIGVAGTLMGAFAAFLKRSGIRVTGTDQNIYPPMSDVLASAGVETFSGYGAQNLKQFPTRPDLVVIGNVIRSDNAEAREAIDQGYAYTSLPEAMEKLLLSKTCNYVVAGTHGKTTTSSVLAFVLKELGQDPSYFIGGVPADLPYSFQVTSIESGRPFVLEGDEYDTAFWDKVPKFNHYLPDQVILTSVEFDHADIYANLQAVQKAFVGLWQRLRKGARIVACVDYSSVKDLVSLPSPHSDVKVITYSADPSQAQYSFADLKSDVSGITFDVLSEGRKIDTVFFQLPGQHNAMNVVAVYALLKEQGMDPKKVVAALAKFRGVKRRQEIRGEIRGVTVIDDFAHHPTAVRETLSALRAKFKGRRLITVFEPRSATSRRKIFQREYAEAFRSADRVWIAAPYDQSRILESDQFSSEELVQDLIRQGIQSSVMNEIDLTIPAIANELKSGDVIAILSNGGFGGFIPKLMAALGK